MAHGQAAETQTAQLERRELESAVVRFAGDSGDGMQLTGAQFTQSAALAGNDLATFPDFPAEIRAPAGTTFGVSAFQINFGSRAVKTAGDALDMLVAMNAAALKVEMSGLRAGGTVVIDEGSFSKRDLKRAGYDENPLNDGTLSKFHVISADISRLTLESVKPFGLSKKEALRCKNMWTLGLVYWMYGRDRQPTIDWLRSKFKTHPDIAESNIAALNAGHAFAETAELPDGGGGYLVRRADIAPGLYRTVRGGEAMAWGLIAGAQLAGLELFFASYPITPASPVLHALAGLKDHGIITFQAEDEIAAVCAAIGASYAGSLGVTSSSGPGIALKGEAIGLAIGAELPLVIINSQRAGPSTGLPTKTEQSDLYQAIYGRNADSPVVVLAARSPSDCFEVAIEAARIAVRFMTPVFVLSDGYIVNATEPWLIPHFDAGKASAPPFHRNPAAFQPYGRDPKTLARPWAIPGTPGLEHRIGGIEKEDGSGNISYDADNHQRMTDLRKAKIANIAGDIPLQGVEVGKTRGRVAVVGWGSTYGPVNQAVRNLVDEGHEISHIHLRHLAPMPRNLGALLAEFDEVLVPEMNTGQLRTILRSEFLIDAGGLNKVTGQPFKISEIEGAIHACLGS